MAAKDIVFITRMKPVFDKIRQLSKPFIDTRHNIVHTAISALLAFQLLERKGGDEDLVIPAIMLNKEDIPLLVAEIKDELSKLEILSQKIASQVNRTDEEFLSLSNGSL